MTTNLYRALATLRKDQEKRNTSFFTPHEQLELALHKARQEKKPLSRKDGMGTNVFYWMKLEAEKRRRENEDLKKRARKRQGDGGQALNLDSIRDWKARLAPYRSRIDPILAHFNPQEMAFLKANPGLVKDVTSRYKALAKKGQGGDTRLGRISPTTARLLDQLIHHGHKEVNPRTGLREYMNNGDFELNTTRGNELPFINIPPIIPRNPPPSQAETRGHGREGNLPELTHLGTIQPSGDCAANAIVGHVDAAHRLGHYDNARLNRFENKFWNLSKYRPKRYVEGLNKSPGRENGPNISYDKTNLGELMTRDNFANEIITGDRDHPTKPHFEDKIDKMINALNQRKGLSAYGTGFYKPNETGFHVVNIPRVHHYSRSRKNREGLEGSLDIIDSNNYKTVRGTIGRDGRIFAPFANKQCGIKKAPTQPRFYFNLKDTPIAAVDYEASQNKRNNIQAARNINRVNRFRED
jgi:hypothetical protein